MSSRMFLPPNYEPICLGHPGRPAHPRHADDPSLLDRTLDLLEHLNDRIALPDLRQLIPRDLEGLQASGGDMRPLCESGARNKVSGRRRPRPDSALRGRIIIPSELWKSGTGAMFYRACSSLPP